MVRPTSFPVPRDDLAHDLALMAQHGDLRGVALELLNRQGELVWSYWPERAAAAWPVIAPATVGSGRVVIDRGGREDLYRQQLRLNWRGCAAARAGAVDDLDGQDGRFRVAAGNRVTVVVTRTGPYFAFGRCLDLARDGIFLVTHHAPHGWQFQVGQRITCTLVATHRGFQARAIRPATA